jgi:ATP-dependent protease ClpP protease subunit
MSLIEFLEFSMRKEAPKPGADWFRIVDKKDDGPAKVYIYDEIGYWGTNAKDFAEQFNDIDASEIHLHINSPGGSVFDGLAIGAAIKAHDAKVIGKVDGMAASAASFILQYCDEREISRNAQVMIHDAKAYAGGNADQMRRAADLLDRVSDNIADIYAVRSGQGTVESWRTTMKSGDTWYSGNEALDAGLVDTVTDNPEEEDAPEEAAKNSWTQQEVEAFLVLPAATLAKDAGRSIITNRVEEAHMSGANPQNQQTPPAAPQPPAPTAQAPAAPAPAAPAPAPAAAPVQQPTAATQTFMVNGVEVTDFAAVQAHIAGLETFKKEAIEQHRKDFVKQLATDGKILASADNITATENFALSLSPEQFENWKATQVAAQKNPLFQQHGVTPGNGTAPLNGGGVNEVQAEIKTLEEIIQSHRDSGMDEEVLKTKDSYKRLETLKAQVAGSAS